MLISVIFFLFISIAIISGLVGPTVQTFKNAQMSVNSKLSYFLAESGIEDASYRILNIAPIGDSVSIVIGDNRADVAITNLVGHKEVVSLGDVLNSERKVVSTLKTGDGVVFKYGTQAGQGGFYLKNNAHVNGNIYSNGDIIGSENAYITGDAFVAGATGAITNIQVGVNGTGDAHAHTVRDSTVEGGLYCQIGIDNNKPCNTSESDPPSKPLPISDALISKWKNDAASGQITTGDVVISTPTALGRRKIVGNLTINNSLTIVDTLYVTGNIIINGKVKLDPSFGSTSGIIISDRYIIINDGVEFYDSGTAGSYILFLSESSCDSSMAGSPCNGNNAVKVGNISDISIINAQKGTVYFHNNARVKEAVGNRIELRNGVGIDYGRGLINVNFTSGPTGSWGIDTWKEGK